MKNKFWLIAFIFLIGMFGTSNAVEVKMPEDLSEIDWIDWDVWENIKANQCLFGGTGIYYDELYLTQQWSRLSWIKAEQYAKYVDFLTLGHSADYIENYDDGGCEGYVNFAYYTEDDMIVRIVFENGNEFEGKLAEKKHYLFENVNDRYILKVLIKYIYDNYEGKRIFLSDNGTDVILISFDPNEADLYFEVNEGYVTDDCGSDLRASSVYADTSKVGICPLFDDRLEDAVTIANPLTYQSGQYIEISNLFFISSEHDVKCQEEGCNNFVSSSGFSLMLAPEAIIGNYCAKDHACGFFWEVACYTQGVGQGGLVYDGYIEGVDCLEKRGDGKVFCETHSCDECNQAVIGVNMLDARAYKYDDGISLDGLYDGDNDDYYSNYCCEHFCWEYMCTGYGGQWEEVSCNVDSDGRCNNFKAYCKNHRDDCSIAGCDGVITLYGNNHRYKVCDECYESLDKFEDGTLDAGTVYCDCCRKLVMLTDTVEISQHGNSVLCFACARKLLKDDGAVEVGGVTISQDDLTSEEIEKIVSILPQTGKESQERADSIKIDISEELVTDKNKYDEDFPGAEITVEGLGVCPCDGEEHTWVLIGDDWYCTGCHRNEEGKKYEEVYVDTSGELADDEYSYNGGYDYSGDDYYYSDDYSSSSTTQESTSPTECIHTNYPVPNSVTFTNLTATTHLQVWTCTNCNAQQNATYNHTYVNGVCVCGYLQDLVAPTVKLIIPEDEKKAEIGDSIVVRFEDNEELKSAKYALIYGTENQTYTKELTGKLQDVTVATSLNAGTYTLLISEVTDAQGNKSEIQVYTFVITGEDENEFENIGNGDIGQDNDYVISGTTSNDKVAPKLEIIIPSSNSSMYGTLVKDPETISNYEKIEMEIPESRTVLLRVTDNEELGVVSYEKVWMVNNKYAGPTTENVSGTKHEITINLPEEEGVYVLNIYKLADANGNALENIVIIFKDAEKEEVDTTNPTIQLVSPKQLNIIEEGTLVKVKFADDKGLNEVKYDLTVTSEKGGEMIRSEVRKFNGALAQDLDLAEFEADTEKIKIDLELSDLAGNVTSGSYVFKLNSKNNSVKVETKGETEIFEEDTDKKAEDEKTTEKVEVENGTEKENSGLKDGSGIIESDTVSKVEVGFFEDEPEIDDTNDFYYDDDIVVSVMPVE